MKFNLETAEFIIGRYLTKPFDERFVIAEKESYLLEIEGYSNLFSRTALMIKLPIKVYEIQDINLVKFYDDLMKNPIFLKALSLRHEVDEWDIIQHICNLILIELSITQDKITNEEAYNFIQAIKYLSIALSDKDPEDISTSVINSLDIEKVIEGIEFKNEILGNNVRVFKEVFSTFHNPTKLIAKLTEIFYKHYKVWGDLPNIINQDIFLACIINKISFNKFTNH
jgi:hypothetical protein